MAKKKSTPKVENTVPAEIVEQPITETIEKNYMPYVMTVIVSRAIPEIDGFKPSHRKLLYTMYEMGLMTGHRTKSANVVGETMKLNPHGDAAIYETLVRLTRGHEALLHPFIDSKGSFGKQYSRENMTYSAPRYTEVKLDSFCTEIFSGIEKNAVDMVPNYDNTMQEPVLLPTTFPNILVSPNMGIAVGMASQICSFNLREICDGTIALLKNPKTSVDKLLDIIKAPDFSGGGTLIYDRENMKSLYETGRGSFRIRSRYRFDKQNSCIEILEIPYSTSLEQILKRLADMLKEGKLKEVSDFRDEIGLDGFKLAIDIKKGTDPDALMARLFKQTPLESDFSANFNVLIDGSPRQLGVRDILNEWIRFRIGCLTREIQFDIAKKREKLHLLLGLGKILLDIDKAIAIVRETQKESEVVPRLMEGFRIDQVQAEYIADIKLRHLNREYIIDRIKEIESLQKDIKELEATVADELKMKALIASQLAEIKKKYGIDRKTQIIQSSEIADIVVEDTVENYNARVILTREGYFKKTTLVSLRASDDHKLKDGDEILFEEDTDNRAQIIFFTNKAQVYRAKVSDFDPVKASALGDFLAAKLEMDEGERPIMMKVIDSESAKSNIIFIFENGKGVRIPYSAYETKGARRRLTGAYSDSSPIVAAIWESSPLDLLIVNSVGKAILINSKLIPEKATRTSSGVQLITMKPNIKVTVALAGDGIDEIKNSSKCRKNKIPATGITLGDAGEQISLAEM